MPESNEKIAGVEMQDDLVAGDQQLEDDIFGLGEEDTGVDESDVAGQDEAGEGTFGDESTEKAFAARLRQEKERVAQEIEERVRQEYEAKYRQQQQQQQQQQHSPPSQAPPLLPRQELETLAEQLGVTLETANAMYHQQWLINQQNEAIKRQDEYLRRMADTTSKVEAMKTVDQRRRGNPNLPEADEVRMGQIRKDYRERYGYDLPWEEAYEKLVAQEAMSGNLTRTAQQKVINNITARSKKTVQAGKAGVAKRPSIEDMSKDEFEALVEQAKAGKFKRS